MPGRFKPDPRLIVQPAIEEYMTSIVIDVEAHMSKNSRPWSVAEAKARLSEVIDRALKEGPQPITRNGRPAVVVVASAEWARRSARAGTLADFFGASPLRGSELQIERPSGGVRESNL
jgi:prevent-host-death family protein